MSSDRLIVRRASAASIADAGILCRLIKKLAEYEKMADKCTATPESTAAMMNEENGLGGIIAEYDGEPVGMMVYNTYKLATFSGKRVLYIEDIFIEENMRRMGIGSRLFEEIKKIAEEMQCIKLEWKCLEWNTSAREFYSRMGGVSDPEWLTYTIDFRKER